MVNKGLIRPYFWVGGRLTSREMMPVQIIRCFRMFTFFIVWGLNIQLSLDIQANTSLGLVFYRYIFLGSRVQMTPKPQ